MVTSLLKTEKLLDALDVRSVDQTGDGEVAFLLFGLFGQDVALECVFSLDFS